MCTSPYCATIRSHCGAGGRRSGRSPHCANCLNPQASAHLRALPGRRRASNHHPHQPLAPKPRRRYRGPALLVVPRLGLVRIGLLAQLQRLRHEWDVSSGATTTATISWQLRGRRRRRRRTAATGGMLPQADPAPQQLTGRSGLVAYRGGGGLHIRR